MTNENDNRQVEFEAAAFRRLVNHLRERHDVQNIDLMNLAGFCRNCLSNWYREAAEEAGVPLSKDQSREIVYGMPYEDWKLQYQGEASDDQKVAFEQNRPKE
ncbi:DUF1244 domain-containing protein [Agrobacterium salinitolerans]|jgi:hypothetical protein|uniref:DUF1244 domain-containing protein n=1 Tax=Agrobacterium salinitolerans TaxID=1183413 RepID=A0A1S9E9F6_9HYPH|nr:MULTISPECIES: DUF1244 domain-containing protein [Agrobacterium]MBA4774499.1 DUF1244 domain-containing protein [Hyphomicrobiales bacterium]PNQ21160.1 DUF1244 domain-containing protein [Rhizobium sp. YIC5082]MCZ7858645.1 DUF1244 domain-containing protein [Agrobacterium salinitolerans]MCZ7862115.1 DUF1244 domain-containing protein [Agrobacterium salinitolerans]MCZ7886261.1 DUF1244 domain-containing protein [Agrobacterium salinitolerans]